MAHHNQHEWKVKQSDAANKKYDILLMMNECQTISNHCIKLSQSRSQTTKFTNCIQDLPSISPAPQSQVRHFLSVAVSKRSEESYQQ